MTALIATGLVGIAVMGASPASAAEELWCPVDNGDGTISYVPPGTHFSLFTCGTDGIWHFGWLVGP
jgi:hypothetical protein